ncbi:MAG TPA: Crp/Fnr family transcriptional regulator [Candidatus Dormibacteraeota bacterium]|nr:Crp/Fnr family transcriptional regulator [Candidatus Dormibacteraeota bacterium]
MDLVAVLAESSLFSGMARHDLEALAPAATSRTFRKGSYIFREGDVGNALYVIRRGQVKISRMGRGGEEAVYAILVPGDSFGEIALLSGDAARTADAEAMELTECISVGKDPLLAFLDQYPALSRHLMQALARYVQQVDESLAEIAFLDISGRVARKLLDLGQSHGRKTPDGIRIDLRLSQRTLAAMVSASRENVNRALQRFVAHGDIQLDGGLITIVRPDELHKRA